MSTTSTQSEFNFDSISIKMEPNPDIGNNMAKITLMGVGGGGCNMVDNYCNKNQYRMKIISANTDNQTLNKTLAPITIQLGEKTTKGLGAGMNPAIGEKAALESFEEIKSHLEGSDMVFVCAGLGGGTGSGAIPIVAKAAKELNILCMCVVTMPFDFEMGRDEIAKDALNKLKQYADSYMVIYNDKIMDIVAPNTGMEESFKIIDDILFDAIHGISEMILHYQRKNINVDFADISTTLTKKGLALIGLGHKSGQGAGLEALKEAINSPLLNIESITRAKSVLVHIKSSPKFPIHEMKDLMNYIKTNADLGTKCITGTVWDNEMKEDEVKITIIATGFDIHNKSLDIEQKITPPIDSKKELSIKDRFFKLIGRWV